MISKSKIKFIKSLQVKKYRQEAQCFIVEGAKSVEELLASDYAITTVVVTDEQAQRWDGKLERTGTEIIIASQRDFEGLGTFQNNGGALAVARMKTPPKPRLAAGDFGLALDDIRDPGNLGTILRIADWYGCRHVIASPQTTDLYNPKVITASMGSFLRVSVYYTDLPPFLSASNAQVYGTFLDGGDVHAVQFKFPAWIVIGNEANGISDEVARCAKERISIPRYGRAESLNAGVATAIILDNLVRSKE